MTSEAYTRIEAYMRSCMDATAHDRQHVYRVLKNARHIAEGMPGVDMDVLETAALLHDIGRPAQLKDPALDHAEVGAEMAEAFLKGEGFEPAFIAAVCHCIRAHRFRKALPPETVEAKILFDADKLDVTGAIGIARTLLYQGQTDRPLYDADEAGTPLLTGSDAPSFFKEYNFKLKNLYDRFLTERGALLARERQKAAVDFYEALTREIEG